LRPSRRRISRSTREIPSTLSRCWHPYSQRQTWLSSRPWPSKPPSLLPRHSRGCRRPLPNRGDRWPGPPVGHHHAGRPARLGEAWRVEVARRLADLRGEDDPNGWAAVVDAWRGVDFVYYRVGAQLELARALIRTGDRDAAADELDDGLQAARVLGAAPLVDE